MRLWFDHSSEVTLHEQIVTQIKLGILSGELGPGERLPSIREIARRFRIHSNTVSAAYAVLRQENWVTHRRGSGVYVRSRVGASLEGKDTPLRSIDDGIAALLRMSASRGVSRDELRERVLSALNVPTPKEFLLIEPEPGLRQIICHELRSLLSLEARTFDLRLSEVEGHLHGLGAQVVALVLPSKAEAVRSALGREAALTVLQIRPIAGTLAAHLPSTREGLIGIASCWPQFLEFARTILVAAGFPADSLVLRDTGQAGWAADVAETDALLCDTLTASSMTPHKHALPFALIAEESLAELRGLMSAAGVVAEQRVP